MLMPIIAAVGSFVVSERILKPKATALFLLACLAIYDIFVSPPKPIISHEDATNSGAGADEMDNTELDEFWDYDTTRSTAEEEDLAISLRCYRGPALLAITMFCAAFSLRVWRRNGVAVDELIFLPGTPHESRLTGGEQSLDKGSETVDNEGGDDGQTNNREDEPSQLGEAVSPIKSCFSEGDAAAGAAKTSLCEQARPVSRSDGSLEVELSNLGESSGSEVPDLEQRPFIREAESAEANSAPSSPSLLPPHDSPLVYIRDQALKGIDMLVVRQPFRPPPFPGENDHISGDDSPGTGNNEVYDAEYAPSAPSVLGAALDLSLPVLFNFHMFCVLMKSHYRKMANAEDEEPTENDSDGKVDVNDSTWMNPPEFRPTFLPLFFITPLIIRSMVPPRSRRRFYKTVLQGTFLTPFRPVRFRDAFIADCVTSVVRPIIDLVSALAYYWTAIYGLFLGKYDLEKAGVIVSNSMFLHGLFLPMLSFLPLFIKLLQTLRQAYDTGKRWPYYGNTIKYFTSGLVILYAMTHAAGERSGWWLFSFVVSTIYQIAWDVHMDWELLVIVPQPARKATNSLIANLFRKLRDLWDQIRLRPKRLFGDDSFYWKALFANAVLRFCWMAGFIPAYRVSILDGSTQVTFVDKVHGWSFVLLATLEIFRRSIWSLIKVELETIKLTSGGENDLAKASTADEYLREGKWKVPSDALHSKGSSTLTRLWRCRSNRPVRGKPKEDAQVVRIDTNQNQYSKLEQTESTLTLEAPKNSLDTKQRHRWLCFSVGNGFLRWLFIFELLLWPCLFLFLSYRVILLE